MKGNPVNLTIPPGARYMTIGFSETIIEGDDAIRSAFEKAERNGVASVQLKADDDIRKATGLDILRMRGVPIEMIYSALRADDVMTAQAMFRTCILEYIYEKIAAVGWGVSFIHSDQLHRKDEQLAYIVEGDVDTVGKVIALTPEHDTLPFTGRGVAKVCNIDSGRRIVKPIGDAGIATVMSTVDEISDVIFGQVSQGISNAQLSEGSIPHIHIIVDQGSFHIGPKNEGIEAEVNIPMAAYAVTSN